MTPDIFKAIVAASGAISLLAGAALCYKQKDGWGWFLFVGFLLLGAGSGVIK